jgi:hypothetical protein
MNVRIPTVTVVGLICVGALLSGCGGSSANKSSTPITSGATIAAGPQDTTSGPTTPAPSATGSGGSTDPCVIMTGADIQAQFGGTASAGKSDPGAVQGPQCLFQVTGSSLGSNAEADDFITTMDADQYQLSKAGLVGAKVAVAVNGVGEDAFYSSATGHALTFLKKGQVITVQAFGSGGTIASDPMKYQAAIVALATAVANRI